MMQYFSQCNKKTEVQQFFLTIASFRLGNFIMFSFSHNSFLKYSWEKYEEYDKRIP